MTSWASPVNDSIRSEACVGHVRPRITQGPLVGSSRATIQTWTAAKYADNTLAQGDVKFYAAPDERAVVWLRPALGPAEETDAEYPIVLSTGRVLEHWHTGTMTMKAEETPSGIPALFRLRSIQRMPAR